MPEASRITLITLPTCSPGWGVHILFVGMLRLQENLKFGNCNTVAAAKLRAMRLQEPDMIHNTGSIQSKYI